MRRFRQHGLGKQIDELTGPLNGPEANVHWAYAETSWWKLCLPQFVDQTT